MSASIALLAACGSGETLPAAGSISAGELADRIGAGSAPRVLDVRTAAEFEQGHIPGAINVPHDALAERLSELGIAPDEEVVVHCQSGRRAAMAEAVLRDAGYTRVRDLTGHWKLWHETGLPKE
ncbi:MAG: rhodanese-like domain-containing protein [Myxococcales bacterium]|nr:rhodanese-like domain-containing protein [Myxococcales bacterium]